MLILFTSAIAGADLSVQMCRCPGIGEEAHNGLCTHLSRERVYLRSEGLQLAQSFSSHDLHEVTRVVLQLGICQ